MAQSGPVLCFLDRIFTLGTVAALKPLCSGSENQLEPSKYRKSGIPSEGRDMVMEWFPSVMMVVCDCLEPLQSL